MTRFFTFWLLGWILMQAECKFLVFAHHQSMLDGIEQLLMVYTILGWNSDLWLHCFIWPLLFFGTIGCNDKEFDKISFLMADLNFILETLSGFYHIFRKIMPLDLQLNSETSCPGFETAEEKSWSHTHRWGNTAISSASTSYSISGKW